MGKNSKHSLKNLGKDKVLHLKGREYIYTVMPSLKKALGITNSTVK